jgi:hypothetical protein
LKKNGGAQGGVWQTKSLLEVFSLSHTSNVEPKSSIPIGAKVEINP